jgi:hydroxypyruvate isomerase
VKVQLDFYHAQVQVGNPSGKLREHVQHIGHFQVAGVPGRHEPYALVQA